MSRPNKPVDVFKRINMRSGDTTVCWEWKDKRSLSGRDGRPYFCIKGKRYLAYRVVFSETYGRPLSEIKPLRHTCDNTICCNPYHLIEGTHQENMDDMKDRERHGLPHHAVKAIKRLLAKKMLSHNEIAELFGISRTLVTSISSETCYQHIEVTHQEIKEHDEQDRRFIAMATKLKPVGTKLGTINHLSVDDLYSDADRAVEQASNEQEDSDTESGTEPVE